MNESNDLDLYSYVHTIPHVSLMNIDELTDIQEILEKGMTEDGRNRYKQQITKQVTSGNESNTLYGQRIVSSTCNKLTDALNQYLAAFKLATGPARNNIAANHLSKVDPQLSSLLSLKCVINTISDTPKFNTVAMNIGKLISDEINAQEIAEENKQAYNVIKKTADTKGTYHSKVRTAAYMADRRGMVFKTLPKPQLLKIGCLMLDLICNQLNLLDVFNQKSRSGKSYKTTKMLRANDQTMQWISEAQEAYQDTSLIYEPMVVPPLDWTNIYDGGYLTPHVKSFCLVKTYSKKHLKKIEKASMQPVLDAVNKIQSSPYKVNNWMLDIIDHCTDNRVAVKGLPTAEFRGEPTHKPEDIDTNPEAKLQWKKAEERRHSENAQALSQRAFQRLVLNTANKYRDFDALWIPIQLDFRGRVYCVPLLNYQGEDYVKSLLTFAEGKPLGEEGVRWLAIHISNLWGNDKVPFEHREMWTHTQTKQLLSYVEDPFTNRGWMDADKPFQFLAACYEWSGYISEGESYVSNIAVALDGSCSGLQNFGMALKCEDTATSVNLIPSERPADIYQEVISDVIASMEDDLGVPITGCTDDSIQKLAESRVRDFLKSARGRHNATQILSKIAQNAYDNDAKKIVLKGIEKQAQNIYYDTLLPYQWLTFGMTRKTAKRCVMTYPYGSRKFGFSNQIREDILDPARKKADELLKLGKINPDQYRDYFPFANEGFEASTYIAEKLFDAVRRKVLKAADAMDWLQDAAKLVAKQNIFMEWTTPLGFLVYQNYAKNKYERIKTTFMGDTRTQVTVPLPTSDVDSRKQANAVSPNFIHSLDSTHLMKTVLDTDIDQWCLVHDSFGTHAAETEKMYWGIRKAFERLYTDHNVLQEFYEEILRLLPDDVGEELSPPPQQGNLDLSLINEARYSFA